MFTLYSGQPFDLSVGHDLYGDTLFNRAAGDRDRSRETRRYSDKLRPLDPNPTTGEQILPRNFGRGPAIILFTSVLPRHSSWGRRREANQSGTSGGGEFFRRVPTGKSSTGGGQSTGGPRGRYTVSLSMSVRNILNHNNPGPIIGNIEPPSQANQPYGVGVLGGTGFSESANNRRLEMQARFNF